MWINDIIRALYALSDHALICCVAKIVDNTIYMTNGSKYFIPDLIEKYTEEFGE